MIAGLKRYPAMKDSGVPWLGAVPAHWPVERLRTSVATALDQTDRHTSGQMYVALEHVESWTGRVREAGPGATFESVVKRFRVGDVLFGKLRPYLAKVARPLRDGVCVSEFLVLRSSAGRLSPAYLAPLLRSKPIIDAVAASTFGAKMPRADWKFVGGMAVPLPPLPEQAAIVRFLDYVDRRIRRYIRAKQKLIKLLEEQKQAIIHRAVTRGLDPNVRLKPSGVEWLGEVPEHWEVVSLKRVVRRLVDCEHRTAPTIDASAYRVIRTTAVRHGRLRWEGAYCTTPEAFTEWTQRAVPEPGDVIFTREAPAGEACVIPDGSRVCLGQRTVLMKVQRDAYVPEFLVWMIYGGPPRDRIRLATQGSTVGHFNMDDIGSMHVLRPPRSEQVAILEVTQRQTVGLDQAQENARREIDLLREYRTRVIADVVTGKLDVREVAARLPIEFDEPEAVDEPKSESSTEPFDGADADETPEEAEA